MTSPTETDAIEAFERLGLTSYEARVFIALQQLGSGTARDVASITDVPRSQVYSVAESLENRGLLEVQQSSPIRYRPVSIDEARSTLRSRFENEQERAFDYVEQVRNEPGGEEEQEDIWTVRGRARIDDRTLDLCSRAEERIVFGTRLEPLVTDELEAALERQAEAGLAVAAVSRTAEVRNRLDRLDGVTVFSPPDHHQSDDRSGRIVIVDDDTILLSVVDDDGSETAIWSAGSLFASVLIQLIEAADGGHVPVEAESPE
ncbi:TrmB family transcriptional regulator [Natrialbaceae archaeon A-CW3]